MRSKTKIIVLHLKELIYTGILLVLGVGLLFLLLQTFLPKKAVPKPDYDAETSLYLPGKYTSTVQLGNDHADVEVVVDSSDILSRLSQPCIRWSNPAWIHWRNRSVKNNPSKASPTRTKTATRHSFCWKRSTLRCKRRHIPKPDQPGAFAKEGLSRQLIQFLLPCHAARIRRHPKVSPRRYRDTSDFRSVRQARTLKLLCKEAAAKGL